MNIINIIDVDFKFNKIFSRITKNSKNYIEKSFDKALDIIHNNYENFY